MAEKVRDDVNGLHFRVGSPEDLADRLTRALEEPGLWDRLAAAAPAPIDLAEFARLHLEVYREIRAAKAAPASRPRPRQRAAA